MAALLAAAATVTMTACSSPAPSTSTSSTSSSALPLTAPAPAASGAAQTEVTTRWWHNSAAVTGSTVDPAEPGAIAERLAPSRSDYCGMLRDTMAAGHSVLAGITPSDPRFAAATTAFVTELQRVAPTEVAASWRVLGGLIVDLVAGRTGVTTNASTIRSAVTTVSADAKTRCGISLSRTG